MVTVSHVTSHHARCRTFTVIYLYFTYTVCRKILKRQFRTSVEKILSVDKKAFYRDSVDTYLSVGVNARSGKHGYQRVEHATFSETEGIRVINQSVALVHHFYFCRCDVNLRQRHHATHDSYVLDCDKTLPS